MKKKKIEIEPTTAPRHLQTTDVDETQVALDMVPNGEISLENCNEAMRTLGLVAAGGKALFALRSLGVNAKAQGIMETMYGTVVFSQQAIVDMMVKIQNRMAEEGVTAKEVQEGARVIGYLSGQLAKLNSATIKSEAVVVHAHLEADKTRRASFAAGVTVTPRQVTTVK